VAAWEACLTVATSTWPQLWLEKVQSQIDQVRLRTPDELDSGKPIIIRLID
jgi:hypothetical protein